MNDVQKSKGANKKILPLFFNISFKVILIIVLISSVLLYFTFTFEEVPPILKGVFSQQHFKSFINFNHLLSLVVYFLSIKKPWDR